MKTNNEIIHSVELNELQSTLELLDVELTRLSNKLADFENTLRYHLEDEIILTQELTILYKNQKQAKKEKRKEQKRRGKNYKESTEVISIKKNQTIDEKNDAVEKEKKKLYRETMLQIHPDKFSIKSEQMDIATQITTNLITIYKTGSLEELQEYCLAIIEKNEIPVKYKETTLTIDAASKEKSLKKRIKKKEEEIEKIKNKHLYKVLMTYKNPLTFVDELKAYYKDRIAKLKKRTRYKYDSFL